MALASPRQFLEMLDTAQAAGYAYPAANVDELGLIYKSLEAVKTLGALSPQDELLEDTIQVVDQSLNAFAH
jgi:hypothetical protein